MEIHIEDILGTMASLRRLMAVKIKENDPDEPLTLGEIQTLLLLFNNPHIHAPGEIMVCLGVSKGLVSRNLNALEEKAYITFETDPLDKRMKIAMITEEGKKAALPLKRKVAAINADIFKNLDRDDLEAFERVLNAVRKEADTIGK